MIERTIERIDDAGYAFRRARVCGLGAQRGVGIDGSYDGDFIPHRIEDSHNGRPDEHAIGQLQRIGVGLRQIFHQPHHVVGHVTEDASSHGRKVGGQVDPRLGQKRAQRSQGVGAKGFERTVRTVERLAVDLGPGPA